jgi:hypothetical protein
MAETLSSLFLRLQAVEATQRASQLSAAGANGAALEHRKLTSLRTIDIYKICGQISAFYAGTLNGTLRSASQIMEVTPVPQKISSADIWHIIRTQLL